VATSVLVVLVGVTGHRLIAHVLSFVRRSSDERISARRCARY
jgi:hypothetical protein